MKNKSETYHYVYRITNIKENRHYIGVHTSYTEPSKDFGVKYFSSSSSSFIKHQKENTDEYIYQILEFFNTRKLALDYERFLHIRYDVGKNPNFYNGRIQSSSNWDTQGKKKLNNGKQEIFSKLEDVAMHKSNGFTEGCLPMKEIQKFKLSLSHSGKKLTEEHKINIGLSVRKPKSKIMKERLSETRTGMIYINNGIIEKIVNIIDLQFFVSEGFVEGKLAMSEQHKDAISKASLGKPGTITGKIYIHRNDIERTIFKSELEYYITQGWIIGRRKHSSEAKEKMKGRKGSTSGKIGINDGIKNKFIFNEDLEKYLSEGWIKGLKSTKK